MAKAATAETVGQKERGPNFKAALSIIRTQMGDKKDRIAALNSDIAELWGKVEGGHKVDKIGAKIFIMFDKLEDDEYLAAWRTLNGLIAISGRPDVGADLVDQAEGKQVDMRGQSVGAAEVEAELDADDAKPAKATKPGKPLSAAAAREEAKRHLRVVETENLPQAAASADPDADLVGE